MNEICILICLHVWKIRQMQFHSFISLHLDQDRKDVDYCIEHQVYFFLGISIDSFFCFLPLLLLLTKQLKQSCSCYRFDCCWSCCCCCCCCDCCDSTITFLFFTLLCVSVDLFFFFFFSDCCHLCCVDCLC